VREHDVNQDKDTKDKRATKAIAVTVDLQLEA
jgi:hypothetical protein